MAPAIKLRGIIDRDYKSKESLERYSGKHTLVLDFHEAESYICLPAIVVAVARALGVVEQMPTREDINVVIRAEVKRERLRIIARRVADKMHVRLGASVKREDQKSLTTLEELTTLLVNSAERERELVDQRYTPEHVKTLVQEESGMIDEIMERDDIERMLQITPGKPILTAVAKLAGAGAPIAYLRACRSHLQIENYPHLISLRQALLDELSAT